MNLKNLVLGIGIIVVFGLVLWQGIETFYPSPQYEDFCPQDLPNPEPYDDEDLKDISAYRECMEQYDTERNAHSKVVFIIAFIVGIITIIIGYKILSVEPVGSTLIGSGVWSLFWGTVQNWRNFSNLPRFLLLLAALVLLILLAIKLNTEKKKSFWQRIGLQK